MYANSVTPQMNQSVDIGGTTARRLPAEDGLNEIKHPLSAIMANADAARRWLSRTDPNFHEVIAALERIVKESTRIDDAIADIRARAAEESPERRLA